MKRSDGITNTGGNAPHTPNTSETTMITGNLSAGIGGQDTPETADQEPDTTASPQGDQPGTDTTESEGNEGPPKKPRLTKEQQLWLNKVFIPNFRRELQKNLKAKSLLSQDERHELEELRSKTAESGDNNDGTSSDLDAVIAKKDRFIADMKRAASDERERLLGIITDVKIGRELIAAASRHNAVNASQVAQLLRPQVRLNDDLNPVVLDDDGERAIDAEGNFMSIDAKVSLFLEENPHMVKPSGSAFGSGSRDSVIGPARTAAITGGDLISEALREESHEVQPIRNHGRRPWN